MELTALLVILGLLATAVLTYTVVRRRDDHTIDPQSAKTGTAVLDRPAPTAPPEPRVEAPAGEAVVAESVAEATRPPRATVPPEQIAPIEPAQETAAESVRAEAEITARRPRFRDRLAKARGTFSGYLESILSRGAIDDTTWEELEEALIRADVGIEETASLLTAVRERAVEQGTKLPTELIELLKDEVLARLGGHDRALNLMGAGPTMWLFVGVNGVGKTTTIGKLAKREADAGHSVIMAAGDTFRAAAADQLATWAERSGAHLVRGAEGSDPAAVIFDAAESAAARSYDLVLADTAGRLHTKSNLMDELRKVRRVADKSPATVAEVLLVLDATTGQNGLTQAREFTDAVELTGVVLTKLDGSAKGGIVLAIQSALDIPVKLVGLGEGIEDLVEFDPSEFVDALFSPDGQGEN